MDTNIPAAPAGTEIPAHVYDRAGFAIKRAMAEVIGKIPTGKPPDLSHEDIISEIQLAGHDEVAFPISVSPQVVLDNRLALLKKSILIDALGRRYTIKRRSARAGCQYGIKFV